MENSPNTDPSQAGRTDQQTAASNVPKSGERPDQGAAPVMNPWADSNKDDADQRIMAAPDTLGAKHAHPILAQPPEELLDLQLGRPAEVAAGVMAVLKSGSFSEDGPVRGTHALLKLNQKNGFDCSSCAWPDPDEHRSFAEFCENGATATASDAQSDAVGPEFFAQHSLVELSHMTDRDLNNAGRLVTITSHFEGQERYAEKFIVVPYHIPPGNCAAYFLEGNALVPIASVAYKRNTPPSKFVVVTVAPVKMPAGTRIPVAQRVAVPA